MRGIALVLAGLLAALASVASAGTPRRVGYPSSIGVIGDSWETGYATNEAAPPLDVVANNWATGTNPAVDSVYARLLAANPAIRGRAYDRAEDGADSTSFAEQVDRLPARLGLVLEVLGGNDLCPAVPLQDFRRNMAGGMRELSRTQPDARILMVGVDGLEPYWLAGGSGTASQRAALSDATGVGACDPKFDDQGSPAPAQVALLHRQQDRYDGVLKSVCARYVHCRWDGAAFGALDLQLADLAPLDAGHPGAGAAAKMAAAIWASGFDFTDSSAPVSRARQAGGKVTLTAVDPQGVAGIEYRLTASGAWTRYSAPLTLRKGAMLTWRAVDVNGNVEASRSLRR